MGTDFPRDRRPSELNLQKSDYQPSEERDLDDPEQKDQRSPYERDRDKILYCRAFRRLKDVTQVARAGETYLHHDRLTHSLKVAQVGQRLAELLRDTYEDSSIPVHRHLDANVVEAASLAHDLGHPPFGHRTEELLDEKVRGVTSGGGENVQEEGSSSPENTPDPDQDSDEDIALGYEGNAQSFRIVTRLVPRDDEYLGLDLTRATLNAILKYPWKRNAGIGVEEDTDDKWGHYPSEERYFDFARAPLDGTHDRTLEAEVMDYADDLTYAIHDVEDFYRDGLIPFDELLREADGLASDFDGSMTDANLNELLEEASETKLKAFEDYVVDSSDVDAGEGDVIEFFIELARDVPNVTNHLFSPYQGTEDERRALNQFVSSMVARYLEALQVEPEDRTSVYLTSPEEGAAPTLTINQKFRQEIGILKQLTFYHVISNPTLAAQQNGQERIISDLFDALFEASDPSDVLSSAIPSSYRDKVAELDSKDDPHRARIVADMIAGMTEPQAVTFHKRLTGQTPGSLQDEIIR